MAQEIMVAGAIYEDVPSVRLPDSNGVFHPFTDTSDTTAVAADVAEGKLFHLADGALATGTASGGGGGGAIKMGVLRPDAELWQRFTYDRWIVADEGVTIPAYTTSPTTLKAPETIATVTDLDTDEYSYYVLLRGLTIPKYVSGTANGAGKPIYHAFQDTYELSVSNSQTIAPPSISYSGTYSFSASSYGGLFVYYTSAKACSVYQGNNSSYGCYQNGGNVTLSTTQIKLTSPRLNIRGEGNGFKQAYWNALEDIRYQYVFEVYRAPNGGEYFDGFNAQSNFAHTLSCATSASGDLT